MDAQEYNTALEALGLTTEQAGAWLGIGRSTAFRYANVGPSGPAARAIGIAVACRGLERLDRVYDEMWGDQHDGDYVRHADLMDVLGLPG